MFKSFKRVCITGLAAAVSLSAASFAGPANLSEWAQEAAEQVDKNMYYSRYAASKGEQGLASFKVTVNSDGDVIKTSYDKRPDSMLIRGSARRTIRKADWPELPEGKDTLTFRVNLNYALARTPSEFLQKSRQGIVRGEEVVASNNPGPVTASITILSADDE